MTTRIRHPVWKFMCGITQIINTVEHNFYCRMTEYPQFSFMCTGRIAC